MNIPIPLDVMKDEKDIIYRLLRRAEIRRSIPRGEPDRIADLLEEAATEIESLRRSLDKWEYQP